MTKSQSTVNVYDTHTEAEEAIHALRRSGFDVKKLSVVGKGRRSPVHPAAFYAGMDPLPPLVGSVGAFWGNVWGTLFKPAMFFLPRMGLTAMAGPIPTAAVAGLNGAAFVEGSSALGSTLSGNVNADEAAVGYDKFMLLVHGSAKEAERARTILSSPKPWDSA